MRLNFENILYGLDGKPLKSREPEKGEFLEDVPAATLKELSINALCVNTDEVARDGQKKFERFILAKRISDSPSDCELTSEEVALVKKAIGEVGFAPSIMGPAWLLLDGGAHLKEDGGIDE